MCVGEQTVALPVLLLFAERQRSSRRLQKLLCVIRCSYKPACPPRGGVCVMMSVTVCV